jgi:hypothetical protein
VKECRRGSRQPGPAKATRVLFLGRSSQVAIDCRKRTCVSNVKSKEKPLPQCPDASGIFPAQQADKNRLSTRARNRPKKMKILRKLEAHKHVSTYDMWQTGEKEIKEIPPTTTTWPSQNSERGFDQGASEGARKREATTGTILMPEASGTRYETPIETGIAARHNNVS